MNLFYPSTYVPNLTHIGWLASCMLYVLYLIALFWIEGWHLKWLSPWRFIGALMLLREIERWYFKLVLPTLFLETRIYGHTLMIVTCAWILLLLIYSAFPKCTASLIAYMKNHNKIFHGPLYNLRIELPRFRPFSSNALENGNSAVKIHLFWGWHILLYMYYIYKSTIS